MWCILMGTREIHMLLKRELNEILVMFNFVKESNEFILKILYHK
jgi:hypothetical protein